MSRTQEEFITYMAKSQIKVDGTIGVEFIRSPPYISLFYGGLEVDIALIYKTIEKRATNLKHPSNLENIKPPVLESLNQELEVTGSPLEAPFKEEDEYAEGLGLEHRTSPKENHVEVHAPWSINDARSILSFYCCEGRSQLSNKNLRPVWVMCDAKDNSKTVLMGLGNNLKMLDRFTVNLVNNEKSSEYEWIKLLMSTSPCTAKKDYGVMTFEYEDFNGGEPVQSDNTGRPSVLCTWDVKKSAKAFSTPSMEASTFFHVPVFTTVLDQSKSIYGLVPELWEDLQILHTLAERLANKNNSTLPGKMYEDPKSVNSELNLEAPQDCARLPLTIIVHNELCGLRPTKDFTDEVWNELKYYTSVSQVETKLLEIFKSCVDTKPVVCEDNKTSVARFALKIYNQGKYGEQRQISVNHLDMMQETGLNKLNKSYAHIFTVAALSAPNALLRQVPRDTDGRAKLLKWLTKVHNVLELAIFAQKNFSLDNSDLCKLIEASLSHSQQHSLKMMLFTPNYITRLIKTKPRFRRYEVEIEDEMAKRKVVIVSTRDFLFPWAKCTLSRQDQAASNNTLGSTFLEEGTTTNEVKTYLTQFTLLCTNLTQFNLHR